MNTRKEFNLFLVLNLFTLVLPLVVSANPPGDEKSATSSSSRLLPKSLNDEKAPLSAQDKVLYDEQFLLPIGEFLSLKDFINTQSLVNKSMCNIVGAPGTKHYYLKRRLSGKWVRTQERFVPIDETVRLSLMDLVVVNKLNDQLSADAEAASPSEEWVLNSDGSSHDSLLGFKMIFDPIVKIKTITPTDIHFLGKNRIKVITSASVLAGGSQAVEDAYERLIQSFEVMTPNSLQNPESLPDPHSIDALKTMLAASVEALPLGMLSIQGIDNREQAFNWLMNMFFTGGLRRQYIDNLREAKSDVMKKMESSERGKDSQPAVDGKDEKNELRETQERQIVSEKVFNLQLDSDGNSFTLSNTLSVENALRSKLLLKTTYERRKEKVTEKEELSGGPSNGKEEQKSEHQSIRGLDE